MNSAKNNKFSFIWFWIFIGSLTLGQLSRFSIAPNISIYAHDVLIGLFLLSVFFTQPELIFKILKVVVTTIKSQHWLQWFILWSLLGIAHGLVTTAFSVQSGLYLVRLGCYGLALATMRVKIHPDTLQIGFATSGILISFFGFLQLWLLPDLRFLQFLGWDDHLNRLVSTMLDPAFTGAILIITYFSSRLFHPDKNQFLFRLVKVVLLLSLLLTFSRASYLALAIIVSWDSWHYFRNVATINLFKAALATTLLIILAGFFILQSSYLAGEGVKLMRTSTIEARIDNINSNLAKQTPVGIVVGSGWFSQLNFQQLNRHIPSHSQVPDNLIVFILTSTGLIGLVLSVGVLNNWLGYLQPQRKFFLPLIGALILHSQFSATLTQPFVFLFLWGTILAWWNEPIQV